MDSLDLLYNKYTILSEAGDKISEHEQDYAEILQAVKGSANEKRLASQLISKFFNKFTKFATEAFDALLDLIEDEDINIRKQAIRDLPTICKESKEFVPKTTDVLTQLLVAEDASELQIVTASLFTLFKQDPKGFITGLFSQIVNGEDATRERALQFLVNKYRMLPDDLMTREVEDCVVNEVRRAMEDCTKDEFVAFMNILSGLKIMKLVSGQQTMLDIITEQADLSSIEASDTESLDKLLMCVKYAIPHFSPFVNSNLFVSFFCQNLLPILDTLSAEVAGVDLEILQYLAEMISSIQPASETNPLDVKMCQRKIFDRLILLLPLPPPDAESIEEPSLQLTHVESLLFSFHQISKHNPDFLTADEEMLKDFKLRLQYLARGVQNYIKKLRESLSSAAAKDTDENKIRLIALKTTTNINTLIRDLFHSPPTFKSMIQLSWKNASKTPGLKRLSSGSSDTTALSEVQPVETSNQAKRKPIEAPADSDSGTKSRPTAHTAPAAGVYNKYSNRGSGFRWGRGANRSRGRGGRGVYSKRYN